MKLDALFQRRVPLVLQSESAECGLACLAMVAAAHGLHTDLPTLRQRFNVSLKGATMADLAAIAASRNESSSGPIRVWSLSARE